MNAYVNEDVACGLIRFHLSGFRGYPNSEAGEKVFARCFQECCVSVAHVQAVLNSFDDEFPTLREIITTANNLRSQFEPLNSSLEEWEQQYGKPQAFSIDVPDRLTLHWQAIRDALYYAEGPGRNKLGTQSHGFWQQALERDTREWPQAVMDIRTEADALDWDEIMAREKPPEGFHAAAKDLTMWSALKAHFAKTRGGWPGWGKISWRETVAAMRELGYPLTHEQQQTIDG